MKRSRKENTITDLTEFTDDEGKKWVQTSVDDLFSMKELNEILETIDKDKEKGEVILARIDFQNVNKEYYEAVTKLQDRFRQQTAQLNKVVALSKESIDKKNKKLKELIGYIKKLHQYLASIKTDGDNLDEIKIPIKLTQVSADEEGEAYESAYEEVEEKVMERENDKTE